MGALRISKKLYPSENCNREKYWPLYISDAGEDCWGPCRVCSQPRFILMVIGVGRCMVSLGQVRVYASGGMHVIECIAIYIQYTP